MATMNISLSEQLKEFVDQRVTEGEYSTTSEYFRDLVREDQSRQSQQKLEALLLEGIESGASAPMTAEDWADVRREVHSRLAQKRSST